MIVAMTPNPSLDQTVDARGILLVIGLGARGGDEVVPRADGAEAERVLDELAAIVASAE